MFNQLKKSGLLINGVIILIAVVLISMAVTGIYQRASAGNGQVVAQSCCGGGNEKTDIGSSMNNNSYGQTISNNPVLTIKELEKNKNKYLGKTVKIEGTITEVCQSMGCWFYVDDGTGTIYVDLGMKGNFTIPKDSAKSHVIVEGIFKESDGHISIKGQGVKIGK
jgi:RecJ-like exonuclease